MRRSVLAFAWALWAAAAHAQVSGSAAAVSDYRFRGISLSGDDPAAQVTLAYDHPSGAYVGAFASNVRLADANGAALQALGFAGYAFHIGDGPDFDVGFDGSSFPRAHEYDYAEIHAGVAFPAITVRISYAPHYFGQSNATWYSEVGASHSLAGPLSVFGHVGVLQRVGDGYT